ncbi:fungal-specific transcription factor domain-containing protein [Ilyonectria sp. MPI-CAGE-AT-0026]|nr:fungal-specific transcription factor domain-containing protein [Ilyonectria sp. MPI-CAGE-AT-0026]
MAPSTPSSASICVATAPVPGGDSDGTAQKRPAWDSTSDRASKRRASKACLSCRNRKVRCDVVNGGVPCTNCRLDGVQCVTKESNRGRKPAMVVSPAAPQSPPPTLSSHEEETSPPPHQPDEYLVSLSFEDQQRNTPRSELAEPINDDPRHPHHSPFSLRDNAASVPSPERLDTEPAHHSVHNQSGRLPPYIRRLPPHISSRDIQYLSEKDALTIPDNDFRDELLRTYVNIVYPFMPALDLEDFIGPIIRQDDRNPVSLLLFQAVMFASVTFVDESLLKMRGYRNRKAARKAFFGRVRLLYGLDCEPDRLSLIQALLLMTYWYDRPDDEKDTWYWMGIALSLAQIVGLHRNPDKMKMSRKERALRCRIWWSCVMRDRLLALGIRRPARIRDEEFNVPMLTLDDFVLDVPSPDLVKLLGESRLTSPDPEGRRMVAVMCIELSKLCVCLGHILYSQYTVLGNHPVGSEYLLKVIVMPRQSEKRAQELGKCDKELNDWLNSQDTASRYNPGPVGHGDNRDKAMRMIRLHQALLHMIYLTTLGVLHRPQVFYSGSDSSDSGISRKVSREKVTEAAIAMTKLAFDLQSTNQLRYLSTSSIPAFLSATLIHLLDIKSPNEEVRNVSIGRFYQCVQALHQLQDMYASADYAVRFLENVLRNTDINIPMLRFGRPQSKLVDTHNERSAFPGIALDISISSRLETAYPSPSSTRNQPSLDATGLDAPLQTSLTQPLSPLLDSFDSWPMDNSLLGDNQQLTEIIAGSPYLSTWSDVDSLVPALINFDVDPNMLMPSNDARPTVGWSMP